MGRETVPETSACSDSFHRELAAFESLLPALAGSRAHRFVAVHNGQVIDEDGDEFALAERIERGYRGEFVLIRRVSGDRAQDHLDSPELEGP